MSTHSFSIWNRNRITDLDTGEIYRITDLVCGVGLSTFLPVLSFLITSIVIKVYLVVPHNFNHVLCHKSRLLNKERTHNTIQQHYILQQLSANTTTEF